MSHSTTAPAPGNHPTLHGLNFKARIALVNYGLKELRHLHNGLDAIEHMLRRDTDNADASSHDLFCSDLASLLATVNEVFDEKIDFLITLAEANQQAITEGA